MFVSGWFPLLALPAYELLVSFKEKTDRKRKKEERKKKNTNRTQTKVNDHHVQCCVKIIPK